MLSRAGRLAVRGIRRAYRHCADSPSRTVRRLGLSAILALVVARDLLIDPGQILRIVIAGRCAARPDTDVRIAGDLWIARGPSPRILVVGRRVGWVILRADWAAGPGETPGFEPPLDLMVGRRDRGAAWHGGHSGAQLYRLPHRPAPLWIALAPGDHAVRLRAWRLAPVSIIGAAAFLLRRLRRDLADTIDALWHADGPDIDDAAAHRHWPAACAVAKPVGQRPSARGAGPHFGVLILAIGATFAQVAAALDAVRGQTWLRWSCVLVVPGQPAPAYPVTADPRIRVAQDAASARAMLDQADWLIHQPASARLHPLALQRLAAVTGGDACDLISMDQDRLGPDGRATPWFKPDWNPELQLSQGYVGPVYAVRPALAAVVPAGPGRLAEGVLQLMAAEPGLRVRHAPWICVHDAAPVSLGDWAVAVARYLGVADGGPASPAVCGPAVRWAWPDPPGWPRVTVVVPTRDRADLLARCAGGVLQQTAYPDLQLVLVDNGSQEAETGRLLARLTADERVRLVRDDGPFNFSRLVNRGVAAGDGEVAVLLNNDTAIRRPDWLVELVRFALRPEVGAVGARLLYANGRVQHAGVTLAMAGLPGHVNKRLHPADGGRDGRARAIQRLGAVTAACMAVRRDVYLATGGFDQVNLPVAYNDVDFCLRLGEAGLAVVWTPYAELFHLEAASRGRDRSPARRAQAAAERAYLQRRWGARLVVDPAFGPNLSLDDGEPRIV